MAGSFEVESDDLVAHASHLDGLVDRLDTATQAAEYAMSDDAYGLLCAFLPPVVNPMGEQAKNALDAASEGMQTMADNVREAASTYRENEANMAEPFQRHALVNENASSSV